MAFKLTEKKELARSDLIPVQEKELKKETKKTKKKQEGKQNISLQIIV